MYLCSTQVPALPFFIYIYDLTLSSAGTEDLAYFSPSVAWANNTYSAVRTSSLFSLRTQLRYNSQVQERIRDNIPFPTWLQPLNPLRNEYTTRTIVESLDIYFRPLLPFLVPFS